MLAELSGGEKLEDDSEANPEDLLRRVEDLLEKTGAKKSKKRKSVKFKDNQGNTLKVKETFLTKESQDLLKKREHPEPEVDLCDFKIEASEPGKRKIINMSETSPFDVGLATHEAKLEALLPSGRGRRERREDEWQRHSPSYSSRCDANQMADQRRSNSRR